jgi:hypothetical protein
MDLLGRKARKLLAQTASRAEQLEAHLDEALEVARSQWGAMSELYVRLDSRESLIRDLIRENTGLNYDLANALFQSARPEPKPQFRPSEALYMSEEEQELRWRDEQGLLRKGELEAALEQLDFDNTEIELDPDYTPRSPTY